MQVKLQDTEPVRWLPSPRGLQSMSAPLVWVVMAHLESARHGRLDKALLVCFCALVHFFFSFLLTHFLFFLSGQPAHSPTCLLYVQSICLSAPLMVPSFGGFVSAPPVIAILCETGGREKKRNKNESPNGFDDAAAGRRACVRLWVFCCRIDCRAPRECSPPTCPRWGISGKLV